MCKLETSHKLLQGFRDLRVEAIITRRSQDYYGFNSKDSKPSNNEGRSPLKNDASFMQADLHEH